MPFRTLVDPVQLARAHGAFESAWAELLAGGHVREDDAERERLKYIVASLAPVANDEADLAGRAIARFMGDRPKSG
jgi:hypothetical protein